LEPLVRLIEQYGLLLVWSNVFLAQAGLPVPAVPALLVAGAFAAGDEFSWTALWSGSVAASLIADYSWYLAGARFGDRALQRVYRILSLPEPAARRIETLVVRWGTSSLLIAKFVPGLGLVAPPIAGTIGVRPLTFLVLDGLGAALWAGVPIALGAYYQFAVHDGLAAVNRQTAWVGVLLAMVSLAIAAKYWVERRHA
jgi:membrane protein DedA with SNARE-associated domain